jgi:hypothetical protein
MAMDRKNRAATETGLYLAVLIGIVGVLNVVSHGCGSIKGLYTRVDTTKAERYTLSKGSGRLISTLKQPMQVDVYVTRGDLAKLDAFVRDLEDLMREYETAGAGKFHYNIIEAKTDDQKQAAKEAGLKEAAFGEGSEGQDQATIVQGYMGMVLKYGTEKDVIPMLSPERADGLEFWITNKIRELRDKADNLSHRIGVLTDKDEIKLSDANLIAGQGKGGPSMKSIMQQALPFYKLEDVDLKSGETEIDGGLDGLIITQPGKDFSDKELRRIDQFVMKGKSLAVFASAANLKASDPSMKATLSLHNLDKLLGGYGIEVSKDVAFDWGRMMRIPVMNQSGGASWIFSQGVSQVQYLPGADDNQQMLDNSFAGFFRIDELSFPFPSSITIKPEKQAGSSIKVIARTSPKTSVDTSESVDLRPSEKVKPKPPFEAKAIAAVAEGKLKSAFGGGDAEGVSIPAAASADARVLVVSSSHFLANPFARSGSGPDLGPQFAMMGNVGGDEMLQMISQPYAQKYLTATIIAFKNTLDWMSGDSDLIAASAKILADPNLTYSDIQRPNITSETDEAALKSMADDMKAQRLHTQNRVQWTLILAMPLAFALFGIARWRMRESKRATFTLS